MSRHVKPYVDPLPNSVTLHQTPASLAIDVHYSINLIQARWNWERYTKLCAFIQMTPYELASLVMMPHRWIKHYRKNLTLPQDNPATRPITLLLTIIEAHWLKNYSSDIIADPFPNLQSNALPIDPKG